VDDKFYSCILTYCLTIFIYTVLQNICSHYTSYYPYAEPLTTIKHTLWSFKLPFCYEIICNFVTHPSQLTIPAVLLSSHNALDIINLCKDTKWQTDGNETLNQCPIIFSGLIFIKKIADCATLTNINIEGKQETRTWYAGKSKMPKPCFCIFLNMTMHPSDQAW